MLIFRYNTRPLSVGLTHPWTSPQMNSPWIVALAYKYAADPKRATLSPIVKLTMMHTCSLAVGRSLPNMKADIILLIF